MAEAQKITIYVRCETFGQSLLNDVASIVMLVGLVTLNEFTIQSVALNFLFGLLGFLALVGWAQTTSDGRRIRGDTADEVCEKLRKRLAASS